MKYHEQLKHPLWQKKRLEVLESNGFACANCGTKEDQLHVHHPYYKRGAMIWDYEVDELECLCEKCHRNSHDMDDILRRKSAHLTPEQKRRVFGYMDGISGVTVPIFTIEGYIDGYIDGVSKSQLMNILMPLCRCQTGG